MKQKFDLNKWLADKSQKVVYGDTDYPVRIILTDRKDAFYPILACIQVTNIREDVCAFSEDGIPCPGAGDNSLFIVTDEPELTEFEQSVRSCIVEHLTTRTKTADGGEISSTVFFSDATAREIAKELLDLARKQIEAKKKRTPSPALTKIVENLTPEKLEKTKKEMLAEPSDDSGQLETEINRYWEEIFDDDCGNYFKAVEEAAKHFYNLGKAEALKDLPKWKKTNVLGTGLCQFNGLPLSVYHEGYRIELSDLEKLPKED